MKIALLLCDHVRPELQVEHQDYPDMFIKLFKAVEPNIKVETFAVVDSIFPNTLHGFDAWLVSGSRHSTLDDLPWIHQLSELILNLVSQKQKIIGVCFGHQLIAQTLGGKVEESNKGRGIGMSTNQIYHKPNWLTADANSFNLIVSHKDQVTLTPESAELIAGSDFCKNYLLQYGNLIFTIQGHPEFSKSYIKALMEIRKAQYPSQTYKKANQSLDLVCHDIQIAQWIIQFISGE